VYLWLRRELRVLRDPGVIATCAGALAIGLSWYVAILIFVPGAFQTLVHALVLPMGGKGARGDSTHFRAPWWYLIVLPARAAPASLALPFVIWRLWRTRVYRDEPRLRFAALCFLVPFAAFSLLPQKQKHYTLVMLPGLALCSADALIAAARELEPRFAWFLRAVGVPLALAGLGLGGVLALYFRWVEGSSLAGVAAWAGVPLLLLAAALAAALFARPASAVAALIPGLLLVLATYRVVGPRVAALPGGFAQLSLDDRERLAEVGREHAWFVRLLLNAPDPDDDDD
jgi:4-amino-4-deoxy-L-arabinose transferase-like glycosyltransferase